MELLLEDSGLFHSLKLRNSLANKYNELLKANGGSVEGVQTDYSTVSKQIFGILEKKKLDIVVTATEFPAGEKNVHPREVYFFTGLQLKDDEVENLVRKSSDTREPKWFKIGERNCDRILDMIVASAAVFPAFRPHEFAVNTSEGSDNPSREPDSFRLVDGGYLHNVPTEAALGMGATHIIIVRNGHLSCTL